MKVLFITYYWPPSGGVSPQRILHFVKHLDAMQVDCHVIHPANASYYQIDESLLQQIPSGATLHPVKIKDVTALVKKLPGMKAEGNIKSEKKGFKAKLSKWARANLFIPDPKANWIQPVVKKAMALIENEGFDLVFTNGTPHSVHMSGYMIKQKSSLPWIADFRDPWTKMDYFDQLPLNKRSLKKHKKLEQLVLKNADITLTVSEQWRKDFDTLGAIRTACITNGYDEPLDALPKEDFTISHVGSLHGDRSIDSVLGAIKRWHSEESGLLTNLVLVGNVNDSTLKKIHEAIGKENVTATGVISHEDAKEWIKKSSALLLPINDTPDAMGRIPAKLFEYLSSRIPILVLGTPLGDAAKIVKDTQSGKCFDSNTASEVLAYLKDIKSGEITIPLNKEKIEAYSRENTARQLMALMASILKD